MRKKPIEGQLALDFSATKGDSCKQKTGKISTEKNLTKASKTEESYHFLLPKADAKLLRLCRLDLEQTGVLHVGTIIRKFHVSPLMALAVMEKLTKEGMLREDGRISKKKQ